MTLTVEMLLEACAKLKDNDGFGDMRVYCEPHALKETTERNFPASRHRSKRIHKKLCKRFGGEFRKEPAIFRIGDKLIAHPQLYYALRERLNERTSQRPRSPGWDDRLLGC